MSPSRLIFSAVLIGSIASVALGRTWTDNQGNEVKAKFVRVHEGNVVLIAGRRLIKAPFANFSVEDQDYIRQQLKAKGQEHLVPPAGHAGGSLPGVRRLGPPGADEEAAGEGGSGQVSGVGEVRTWTDIRGRTMKAQFVGLSGANVVLVKDGRRVTYPFMAFSPMDRQYIRGQLEARGEEHLLPGYGGEAGMGEEPMHMTGPGPSSFPGPGGLGPPPMPDFPGPPQHGRGPGGMADYQPEEMYDESDDTASDSMVDDEPEEMPEPGAIAGYGAGNMPGYRPGSGPPGPPPGFGGPPSFPTSAPVHGGPGDQFESGEEPDHGFAGGSPLGGSSDTGFYCSNCNKDVPAHLGAGDRCPHCGVYWEYEETADGRTLDASGQEVTGWSVGGIVFAVVVTVVALAIRLAVRRS